MSLRIPVVHYGSRGPGTRRQVQTTGGSPRCLSSCRSLRPTRRSGPRGYPLSLPLSLPRGGAECLARPPTPLHLPSPPRLHFLPSSPVAQLHDAPSPDPTVASFPSPSDSPPIPHWNPSLKFLDHRCRPTTSPSQRLFICGDRQIAFTSHAVPCCKKLMEKLMTPNEREREWRKHNPVQLGAKRMEEEEDQSKLRLVQETDGKVNDTERA